jgi:uncharacterized protein YgiB involved in biofilm formation
VPRRASRNITLVLIGAAALQGCSPSTETQTVARDDYQSLEDCAADWGRPEQCERQQLTTNAGSSTYWRGPMYFPGNRWSAQRQARDEALRAGVSAPQQADGPSDRSIRSTTTTRSTASSPTSRGGFGSSARSYGSSSS